MKYRLTVKGFDSGLNEMLNLRATRFDGKHKTYHNNVKGRNDDICKKAIRCSVLRNVKITKPIIVHYKFYCKDKRRDRLNVASAFEKSFADALQKCGVIKNDGWNDLLNVTYDFDVDKNHPRIIVEVEEVETYKDMYDWKGE